MCLRRSAGGRLTVDSPQPHDAHQPLHPLPAYRHALPVQRSFHPPGTVEGRLQVVPVALAHQGQVLFRGRPGAGVEAGTAHPSSANWRTRDRDGCSRSTISRRWAGLIDGPLRQEIPLYLQPANLLVQAGDQGGGVPGFLLLAVAEDAGGALAASWAAVSWPFSASRTTLALRAGRCFLRPWDTSPLLPDNNSCPQFRSGTLI